MKREYTTQDWLKLIGKEKLQTFQDYFTKVHGFSLGFYDLEGNFLTVESSSSLFCYSMQQKQKKRCIIERNHALSMVKENGNAALFACYSGLNFFMCPVYFNRQLVAFAYGGGVAYKPEDVPPAVSAKYEIPIISEYKLMAVISLLEYTMNMLNLDVEQTDKVLFSARETAEATSIFADKLSKREIEVARLMCLGYSNKKIADTLFISEKTVKSHVSSILGKLDIADRMQLVVDFGHLVTGGSAAENEH